jgi:sugar phosphate permease
VEAGFGAGQLLLVPSALLAISTVGWRTTLLGAAVLLSAGIAPILWRHLRDRPADVGLLPIGGPLPAATGARPGAPRPRRRCSASVT